ncbi:Putative Pfs, NACHT and Ankyrin domain protein [[Torrubiella] hemipterigena]|uniref:Putative Pfs, NACHT and Ankyrin domain protein n=1 Tax=[Torrubiella] hemipterigena TaxID=1531966 RepID=A0A0A1TC42_9HYPO|nr:Putative Pfs, NACHT and Ankyrin domain protein [[Torrubiella] hemipterigena]
MAPSTMASQNALDSPESYVVAWIAALPIERAAAEAMLDEEHAAPAGFNRNQSDENVYTWGRVGEHNVVIASLAAGVYGTTSAATTASSLLASLPSIRVGIFVGIGGGIPRPDKGHDVRLGDIVVSQPDGTTGGVCQYDLYKAKLGDKRERKGFLGRPPIVLLNALTKIQAVHERKTPNVAAFLENMLERNPKMAKRSKQNPGYAHQGLDNDRLFKSSCDHAPGPDCRNCNSADEIQRDPRDSTDPEIHYGTIASGNTLVKDAATRDRIAADIGENCLCFEMEAAGLMNHFPCLVIRGICDYADSHKNDRWQRYAAATAAAYAKELLAYIPTKEVQKTKKASEVLQSIQQRINEVQQTTAATKAVASSVLSDIHTEKIRRWLRPPDPSKNLNEARKRRHEGTGTWLLENPVFREWHSGSHRYVWLNGLAGCGKTILSATVLDYLITVHDGLLLFFFFDFSDATKQTLDGMLRSFAFQLYLFGAVSGGPLDESFQVHRDGHDQPTTKTLEEVVGKMLAAQKECSIVIDALDESTTRTELLLWIKDMVANSESSDIKLICTSRPELEFLDDLPPLISPENCLELDKEPVNADIRSYVAAQLSQWRKPLTQDLLERIQKKVGDGADGMFRWAFCQLDSLARCRHEAAIERALDSLPQSLDETYRDMIKCIPMELKNDAVRLLQFLVHSERPITLAEAIEVIATQIDEEPRGFDAKRRLFNETDVLSYCPGLVTVVQASDKELHLAHFSVKEYLLGESEFNITTASIPLTMTCLVYLTNISGSYDEITQRFPMSTYAAQSWTRHASLAQADANIVQATVRFLEEEVTLRRWTHIHEEYWRDDGGSPRASRLYYACLSGLINTARCLIVNGTDVNAQGGRYGTALQAASFGGYQEIIRFLLEKDADVNAQNDVYGTALQAASLEGHQEIFQLLLEKDADVNAQGGSYGTALQAASFGGYQAIVQLLLEKDADVNAQGGIYSTALQAASAEGHQEIIQLLLEKGADVNAQGGRYGTALQAASVENHQEIVRLLLENDADVNAQGGRYGTTLQAASLSGHHEIVQLLLEKGADVNAQGGRYGTALQAASANGHQEIVRLLLENDADVNAQNDVYGTALQAASAKGHQEIVQLLLEKGADVNAQGGEYGTALYAASLRRRLEIVQLLLEKGADVNAQGGEFGTALQGALIGGCQEIVELLLENGADANV